MHTQAQDAYLLPWIDDSHEASPWSPPSFLWRKQRATIVVREREREKEREYFLFIYFKFGVLMNKISISVLRHCSLLNSFASW